MSATTESPVQVDHEAIIVGSGFSGLAMAIRLKRAGHDDFVVLERGDSVGGTWRDNTYPGCACDVPSHLYSFSFAPNPGWTRHFAPQGEIRDYLEQTTTEYGIRPHLRFGAGVEGAFWDDGTATWKVELKDGRVLTARFLISAIGGLSTPSYPAIAGRDEFAGPVFHTAEWDHDVELAGKRVAVIGTGASAVQVVPAIAHEVDRVEIFQRTAPWILPKPDRAISKLERRLFRRVPALQRAQRRLIYWALETRVIAFAHYPQLLKLAQKGAVRYIKSQIDDPELQRKVTPDYTMGCKRILPSNNYYRTLNRDNVDVVTDGIERISERGIVTTDGVEHEADVIVFGTGFQVQEMLSDLPVRGRDGRDLRELWDEEGMRAHRGTTVAGFPNLFFLLGPNTGLGHTSIIHMIESQAHYIVAALDQIRSRDLVAVEPKASAQREFNSELDRRQQGTVWTDGGCRSWYLDENGRNTTIWPDFTFKYRSQMSRFDLGEYEQLTESSADSGEAGPKREPALAG